MPLDSTGMIPLSTSTLGELCRVLEGIRKRRGDDLLVITEVGINNGADVFIGQKALNIRENFGHSITISADEPTRLLVGGSAVTFQEQVVR